MASGLASAPKISHPSEEIHKIATEAAASIEDTHPWADISPEKLVEQVDVNWAELLLKRRHG